MRNWMKVLYWAIAGGFVGFGLIGVLSIGYPFLVAGVIMGVLGISKLGIRSAWSALVGFGAVPAAFLSMSLISVFFIADPSCSKIVWGGGGSMSTSGSVSLAAGEESIVCSVVPGSYVIMLVIFSAIALSGVGWRALQGRFA